MLSNSMVLYNLVSSSSLQIVPPSLASGNFDQLKLFRGLEGLGMFFLATSNLVCGSGGGGPPNIGAHGGGGGPGGPGGGGGGGTLGFDSSGGMSKDLLRPVKN